MNKPTTPLLVTPVLIAATLAFGLTSARPASAAETYIVVPPDPSLLERRPAARQQCLLEVPWPQR